MRVHRKLGLVAVVALIAFVGCAERGSRAQADGEPGKEKRVGYGGGSFTPHENLEAKVSLRPQAITVATVTGTAADKEDFEQALVYCDVAALGGTAPTLDVKVQDADTSGGTYGDVAGAAFTQFTATRDDGMFVGSLALRPRKQFLRLSATGAGTSPTGNFACGFVFAAARTAPVSYANAADFNVK